LFSEEQGSDEEAEAQEAGDVQGKSIKQKNQVMYKVSQSISRTLPSLESFYTYYENRYASTGALLPMPKQQ
jgi:hypothetical protein